MSKKVKGRLRELAPAARRNQDAGSRNLAFPFLTSMYKKCSTIDKTRARGLNLPILVTVWQLCRWMRNEEWMRLPQSLSHGVQTIADCRDRLDRASCCRKLDDDGQRGISDSSVRPRVTKSRFGVPFYIKLAAQMHNAPNSKILLEATC